MIVVSTVHLAAEPQTVQARPGQRLEVALTVWSTGCTASRYRVDLAGIQQGWYELDRTYLSLSPGASERVRLTVHPPDGPAITAGRYPFRVQVTSEDDPATQASTIVELVVGADAALSIDALPANVNLVPRARFTLASRGGLLGLRRPPLWAAFPTLGLVLLLVVLAMQHALATPSGRQAVTPSHVGTPTVPVGPAAGIGRAVTKAAAPAPSIQRFILLRGQHNHPPELAWQTRNATRVTLDGRPVAASGHVTLHDLGRTRTYRLVAGNGRRRVAAQVRVTALASASATAPAPVTGPVSSVLLNPPTVSFGHQRIGTSSAARTINVVNLGPSTLVITGVTLSGPDATEFAESNTCANHAIGVYAACTIRVRFTPKHGGSRSAGVAITGNIANGAQHVSFSGRA